MGLLYYGEIMDIIPHIEGADKQPRTPYDATGWLLKKFVKSVKAGIDLSIWTSIY